MHIERENGTSRYAGGCRRGKPAFTLIELLVTIGIIGVCIAMILPAVQSARESARRARCQNNLKQIGIGVAGYMNESAFFPAGRILSRDPRFLRVRGAKCSGPFDRSVFVALLPYLEQSQLYDTFNHGLSMLGDEQTTSRSFVVGILSCPSDTFAGSPVTTLLNTSEFPWAENVSPFTASIGSSSYAACHSVPGTHATGGIRSCEVDAVSIAWSDGCFNDLKNITLASVTDGLSHTMSFAEKSVTIRRGFAQRIGMRPEYWTSPWVIGEIWTTHYSAMHQPNSFKARPEVGDDERFWMDVASSQHPGGLNVLMGDGSVRFVSETIDSWNRGGARPFGVWQRLATRNGGEVIDSGAY